MRRFLLPLIVVITWCAALFGGSAGASACRPGGWSGSSCDCCAVRPGPGVAHKACCGKAKHSACACKMEKPAPAPQVWMPSADDAGLPEACLAGHPTAGPCVFPAARPLHLESPLRIDLPPPDTLLRLHCLLLI